MGNPCYVGRRGDEHARECLDVTPRRVHCEDVSVPDSAGVTVFKLVMTSDGRSYATATSAGWGPLLVEA